METKEEIWIFFALVKASLLIASLGHSKLEAREIYFIFYIASCQLPVATLLILFCRKALMCQFCSVGPRQLQHDSSDIRFAGFFSADAIEAAIRQANNNRGRGGDSNNSANIDGGRGGDGEEEGGDNGEADDDGT